MDQMPAEEREWAAEGQGQDLWTIQRSSNLWQFHQLPWVLQNESSYGVSLRGSMPLGCVVS